MPELSPTTRPREPGLGPLPLADDGFDRHSRRPKRFPWLAIVALIAIAAAAIVVWRLMQAPPPAPQPPAVQTAPPPPAAAAETPPIRYPIEAAQSPETTPAAPGSAVTEPSLLASLLALPGTSGLDRLIVGEDVVHRFVATVDNLPRTSVASKVMVVQPAAGAFAVDAGDGHATIGRGNAARYAPYVQALQSLDTAPLVALYVRNYALFQQAYRDLGYPNGYFNDRLIDAIDDLLAAPEPAEPPGLLQPKVLYEYANPDYQSRSAGQKAMMRLGPEGERAAKAKLREIRAALTKSGTQGARGPR